jgi:hypothetical protein
MVTFARRRGTHIESLDSIWLMERGEDRCGGANTGVHALMWAVLEDGLRSYLGPPGRIQAEAECWVHDQREWAPFSFTVVCETLGLAPTAVRAALRRRGALAGSAAHLRRGFLPGLEPDPQRCDVRGEPGGHSGTVVLPGREKGGSEQAHRLRERHRGSRKVGGDARGHDGASGAAWDGVERRKTTRRHSGHEQQRVAPWSAVAEGILSAVRSVTAALRPRSVRGALRRLRVAGSD